MCRIGLFPWFCPFSECRIIPVWGSGSPRDTKWLLDGVFLGPCHGRTRGWVEIPKLSEWLYPSWLPAPRMFAQKLVCGQEKSATSARFDTGCGGVENRVILLCRLCGGVCPGRCRAEWGFGAEMSCRVLFPGWDVAFRWQGHSRVANVRILVAPSRGLAAFVCHREQALWKTRLQPERLERQ